MTESINITIVEERLVFNFQEPAFLPVTTDDQTIEITVEEPQLIFTIQNNEIVFSVNGGVGFDTNFGRIHFSNTDSSFDYLANKITYPLINSENKLAIDSLDTSLTDTFRFNKHLHTLKNIAIGDVIPSELIGFDLTKNISCIDTEQSVGINLFPTFTSDLSSGTFSISGINGYTITNIANFNSGSQITALNFGNVVGLGNYSTGTFPVAGNSNLIAQGIWTFGCMPIFAVTTISNAIGLTTVGAIAIVSNLTIERYCCSGQFSASVMNSCPLEKILNIQKPSVTATNAYQLTLEGNGDRSGIWFNAPAIQTNITNPLRLYAASASILAMSINNSVKFQVTSFGMVLGAGTTDRVTLVAGIAGNTPVTPTSPAGWWSVTIGGNPRQIPYYS